MRKLTTVAGLVVVGLSVGVYGGAKRGIVATPQAHPTENVLRTTVYSDNMMSSGRIAAYTGGRALVFVQDCPPGRCYYGLSMNFNVPAGGPIPGMFLADNCGLGAGFAPGGQITAIYTNMFRSEGDPAIGQDDVHIHLELWDGDPFGWYDTPAEGFAGAKIAGSDMDFTIPARPGDYEGHLVDLYGEYDTPVVASQDRVWLVIQSDCCRLYWNLAYQHPSPGYDDPPGDLALMQVDWDGCELGGTCCYTGGSCNEVSGPYCMCEQGADYCLSNAFGIYDQCSDGDAESQHWFTTGGCTTDPGSTRCANFQIKMWAATDYVISLVPVSADAKPEDDPPQDGWRIEGDEIIMAEGGRPVWIDIRVGDWDPAPWVCIGDPNAPRDGLPCTSDDDCPWTDGVWDSWCGEHLRAWCVHLDPTGYTSGLAGALAPRQVSCSLDSECVSAFGAGAECEDDFCTAGFIDAGRSDWVFNNPDYIPPGGTLPHVNLSELDYYWGTTLTTGEPVPPAGQWAVPWTQAYLGTLVVDVPSDATGTFTIPLWQGSCNHLLNMLSTDMQPLGLVPAKITVEVGQCCFGLGSGHYGCIDQVTVGQCPGAGLCHGVCSEDGTTPCITDDDCTGTCSGLCAGTLANCWDNTDCPAGECSDDTSACYTDDDCTAGACTISGDPCHSDFDCAPGICSTWDYWCVSDADCATNGGYCDSAHGACGDTHGSSTVHCTSDADCVGIDDEICRFGVDPELCVAPFGVCDGGDHCMPDVAGEVCHPDLDILCPGDQECIVQGDYLFFPGRDCSDPCQECTDPGPNDPYCADGDACTVDVCTDYLRCDHTPVEIGPDECCDYTPDSTEDDLAGAGSIVSKYVGQEQCRGNVCAPATGCALEDTGQCGVPYHPPSAYGTACDDWENCTYNDVCDGEDPPTCAGSDVGLLECTWSEDCLDQTGTTSECIEGFCHCVPEALYPKSRYISLMPQDLGTQSAMRVTFIDLPTPFDAWNGVNMWVGPPTVYCENSGQATPPQDGCGSSPSHAPTFLAATLQCQPHYADWDALAALHIYHEGIVPSATYGVQAIEIGLDISKERNYTEPLELTTSGWSDVIEDCATQPCGPPDGVVRMTSDVTGFVNKFKNLPVAVMQTRTDLVSADNGPIPDQKTTVIEFVHAVDAFGGAPYPFSPGLNPCTGMAPRISEYSDSGCLPGSAGGRDSGTGPCPENDQVELTAGPGRLDVTHWNAAYNCCQDDIMVTLSVEGNLLRLNEEEVPPGGYCDCICCFNVNATIVDIDPGQYTVRFCWFDYETGQDECHIEDVAIP